MRMILSCIGLSTALMLTNAPSSIAASADTKTQSLERKTIYGLSNARHVKASSSGEFYIQAGTFKSLRNADDYKSKLINKYHQPVYIKKQGTYHVVYIGPLHSAAEVRALNKSGSKVITVKQEITKPQLQQDRNPHHLLVVSDKDAAISPVQDPNHFEVIGALGVANLMLGDGYMGVTSDETDRLVQTNSNDWDTFTGQLGLGYVYYLHGAQRYSENTQWFPWIEPELNGYYLGRNNIKGDVWRFGSPAFNDMTYNMSVESYRLMFDTALTVVSRRQYSLYAIGGIGGAWNRVGYSDADRSSIPCADQYLNLNTRTNSSFSWEAGAGLSYAFNNRFALSLEYLYTDLGKVKTHASGYTGTITVPVIVPANMELTSQAALLGLHVAI
ncbi:SPOR domain-containing protein [Legionella bononiensis]|uniref:SPOR domain-containing protein n=1 Tax=Legionella bononiensis TaxID=2793102 RepID=A0ABS1WG30_9GAMM|nr:SPOR domain-containing protein [Legionella bononiensis]MBL7481765.1 SPOR domain-containing protein [Legionella bononiensis]MBL7528314.1 SPOR domain-containing protein [Legionella bononiensis]MBL7562788.1 SPOR domain-containing protein [Legionella bononiensis]